MSLILRVVDGIPRMVDIPTGGVSYDVDEELLSTLTANTAYTIPGGNIYNIGGSELQVFVDGVAQKVGVDYTEFSTTQIKFPSKTINAGQRIRIRR